MKIDNTIKLDRVEGVQARRKSTSFFTAMIVASLFVHGSAIAGLAIWKGKTTKRVDLSRAIPVRLVRLGKKRDPKMLPRLVRAAAPKDDGVALDTSKSEKPKPPTAKPEKPKEMSDAAKQMLAGRSLDDAFAKIDDDEPEGDPEGDPSGTATEGATMADKYHREIVRTLQAAYRVPTVIPASQRQFLKARVVLFIERNGRVASYEFVERHPNKVFTGALESLLRSIELPPPPAKQAKIYRDDGVEIIFRP